jgi:hypothetical protein
MYRSHVGLLYEPCFGSFHLHRQAPPRLQRRARPLEGKGGTMGEKYPVTLPTNGEFHAKCRDLLHAANLRQWTDGFTSPPKEGTLRIFFALKNPTASAEFEPANLGILYNYTVPCTVISDRLPLIDVFCRTQNGVLYVDHVRLSPRL